MLYRRGVIAAVRNRGNELFQAQLSAQKLEIAKRLAAEICGIYGREVPTISLRMSNANAHGMCGDTGIILHNKVSLTTLLHELYHWLTLGTTVGSDESIARQWSVSLYIRALPQRAYRCRIAMGGLMFDRRNSPSRRLSRYLSARTPSVEEHIETAVAAAESAAAQS